MAYVIFNKCFMFLIILPWAYSSLLSRFRYPNEYIASPESMVPPEDLPQDLYDNLIDERPELKPIFGPMRKTKLRHPQLPYLRKSTVPGTELESESEYEYRNEGIPPQEYDDEGSIMSRTARYSYEPDELDDDNMTTSGPVYNTSRMMPFLSRHKGNDSRRWIFFKDQTYKGRIVARCYLCNAFLYNIPVNPSCHTSFHSNDWRALTQRRYHRTNCHWYDSGKVYNKIQDFKWSEYWTYTTDRGLKRAYAGRFIGGCYKRFMDIGEVYTSRGCRLFWPYNDYHLANHRMVRLEVLLKGVKEGCISSPHASLTPFSRAISLYVRYHVCVCEKRYCNKATVNIISMYLLFLGLLFIVLL